MNRVEKCRRERKIKLKIVFLVLLFCLLLIAGIIESDYTNNMVMLDNDRLGIVNISWTGESNLTINIMNRKLTIDTRYIRRDYYNLKKFIESKI